ncbi:MAG: AMP-binding protein [Hyphomicrobiaceae bacterium]
MNALPLITGHGLDGVLAWLPGGPRRVRDFLADAEALAARLPSGSALLNLCHDRYRFAVGFAAGLITGRVSLQPASHSSETLLRIRADFPDLVCLCDGDFDTLDLPRCDFPELAEADPQQVADIPRIPVDRLAAILFTSGSTGLPQPQRKTWGRLVANGRAGAAALGLDRTPHALVGTVPVQHSYGFESTLLLALHGGCAFWCGKPFYPQDIAAALEAVPRPRLLVTTPFHLSTLLASGLELPAIDQLLSATAPLPAALAAEAEARAGAPLTEIYGSTESGQLASRRTTDRPVWTLLPGVRLQQEADTTYACDGHVEGRVALADIIELLPQRRFLLQGRQADLVNIAGKRTSLAYLNHQIAAVPGVVDAAFFLPDDDSAGGITRLTAFVVAPTLDSRQLLAALRQRIDALFLPRPPIFVDALPRNSTGKLPRSTLQALYAERVRHAGR